MTLATYGKGGIPKVREYTPWDMKETTWGDSKINWCGSYIPENFWEEYGKFYLQTFRPPQKDGTLVGYDDAELNTRELMDRIDAISPKTVLEVGCGFGRCLPYILESTKSIKRIVGVDFSSTMVKNSKDYLAEYKDDDRIKVIQADARDLPFKDDEFGLVYTHACLTHIPPKFISKVISEISRVAQEWIIHIERFVYLYEHPNPHRWSHMFVPFYLNMGWEVMENIVIQKDHHTNMLTLKKEK